MSSIVILGVIVRKSFVPSAFDRHTWTDALRTQSQSQQRMCVKESKMKMLAKQERKGEHKKQNPNKEIPRQNAHEI